MGAVQRAADLLALCLQCADLGGGTAAARAQRVSRSHGWMACVLSHGGQVLWPLLPGVALCAAAGVEKLLGPSRVPRVWRQMGQGEGREAPTCRRGKALGGVTPHHSVPLFL